VASRLTDSSSRQHAWGIAARLVGGALTLGWLFASHLSMAQDDLAEQGVQYDDDSPKTILELQRFRSATHVAIQRADGVSGSAELINLNPAANAWYLLTITWSDTHKRVSFHLENADPKSRDLQILSSDNRTLDISTAPGTACRLWASGKNSALQEAAASALPYAPLCEGAVYLRNPVVGHQTSLERVTDFLRDHVWGGDRLIGFVKREFYTDEFLEKNSPAATAAPIPQSRAAGAPWPAAVAQLDAPPAINPNHLAFDIEGPGAGLEPGQWYAVHNLPGVLVSAIAPENISADILNARQPNVNLLSSVESNALVYLTAFDLQQFDLHFALGTDHPRLDWSDRPPPSSQDPDLPGPDGVANSAPLVTNGMISPVQTDNTVATFAGGFKRAHGAFKYGPLSQRNHGSHYGFIEQGVVFSKLQPGLATVVVMDDGSVNLETWSKADDAGLEHIRYARQNGVPLIEFDPGRNQGITGSLVNQWGPGNWSGSADEDLRTLRAGLCLQDGPSHRFLIYGYFSAATPSAMARVFQAYHCRYAMHLDMNALEHTYLALYVQQNKQTIVEHLIDGMEVVDRTSHNELAPRFLGFPDDRDFFYLTRRRNAP